MAEEGEDAVASGAEQEFNTDTGRKVFGSGGITPDVIVKPRELSRTVQILEVRSVIFNFGVEYFAKNPDLDREVRITNEIIEQFAQSAIDRGVIGESAMRDALANQDDREYIARALRAEIVAAKYGYDASYPIRLEGDDQVKKALELFPEAQKLSRLSAQIRNGGSRTPVLNERSAEASKRSP
jgi:carboxyl-terminal processing protease